MRFPIRHRRGLAVGWATTGNVTLASQQQSNVAPSFGPDGYTRWHRAGTARLGCNGTATATITLPDAAPMTAQANISCRDAVEMAGLADQTLTGTGTIGFADPFTVTPAAAQCAATSGTVTPASGAARTLSVSLTAPRTRQVTVACAHPGRAPASQTVALAAAQPCSQHLGELATGTITRCGTIADNAACTSTLRPNDPRSPGTYYAQRYTFSVDSPGWVTVNLDATSTSTARLDTYLIVLNGHGDTGTDIGSDDDSGPATDSLLADMFLQPGDYTIEATTRNPQATGNYTLTINATYDTARCAEHLGTLTAGRVSRAASITAGRACTTLDLPTSGAIHYARRHTFSLTSPAWVDIEVAPADSRMTPRVSLLTGRSSNRSGARIDYPHNTRSQRRIGGVYLSLMVCRGFVPGG